MESTATLVKARTDVFGKDPALGTDGQPLERGVGSHWHRAEHIAKAHFHAADAWAGCDDLVSLAKQQVVIAQRITAAVKASIEAAAAAKQETPAPADPKDSQAYKDLKVQCDQVVAERDVLTKMPAATAHNVALDAAEQKLLDDYRAEQKRAEEARLKKIADDAAAAEAAKPVVVAPVVPPAPVAPKPPAVGITAASPQDAKPIVPAPNPTLSFATPPAAQPTEK
jgi:hypothetical protein